MAGVRVSQIPDVLDLEDLKIYFSNSRHSGGKIAKIYFPLLNNDAVIFFHDQEVVDLLLSRDHSIDDHDVYIVRTEAMVFSEVSAKLSPEISSLVSVSNRIKERLEYVIEVQLEESPEDHCIVLTGDIYQIELAWNAINKSLKAQQKIHSRIYQKQESKDGDRERSKFRKDGDNDTSGTKYTVHNDSLSQKVRGHASGNANRSVSHEMSTLELDCNPYTSQNYRNQSTARVVEDSAKRKQASTQRKTCTLREYENVPTNYMSSHNESHHSDSGVRPKENSIIQSNQTDLNRTAPTFSTLDQLDSVPAGSLHRSPREKLKQEKPSTLNTSYENMVPDDRKAVLNTRTYHVNNPKVQISNIGDISDDTADEDEIQKFFQSSKGSSDSERSRQANDTFREFSTVSPQQVPQEDTAMANQMAFSTDFSLTSHHEFTVGNLKVVVTLKNITAVDTDGLVNAANGSLLHSAGVAGAISKAADVRLETECEDYIRRHGMMSTTQVMHTSAGGRLKVSHILHAVGPIWLELRPERCTYELIQTYLNCFEYADNKLRISSISVPCISSGIFGAPLDTSVQCFLDAVLLYYVNNKTKTRQHLKEIHMVNNDADAVVTTIVIINSLLEGGLQQAVNTAREKIIKLEENVGNSAFSVQSHTDDWSPQSLPAYNSRIRRTASLDRNSARSTGKSERHEFQISNFKMGSKISPAVPKSSSNRMTETKIEAGSKYSGRSPVFKQTLTNPSSLRPKTAPSKTASNKTKAVDSRLRNELKFTSDYDFGINGGFDGTASLPAHIIYQNHLEDCPICFETIKNPKVLDRCQHSFCQKCIDRHFDMGKPVCPLCGILYGIVKGDQPLGTMSYKVERSLRIPGYEDCDGAIVIQYNVPAGIQLRTHPNPGKRYKALKRTAYLPNNTEGKQIYRLLRKAFDNKLIFTIGASRTTGREDVVTWNDIHHKTSVEGGPTKFGYPDSTYMNRVREELAAKGLVS